MLNKIKTSAFIHPFLIGIYPILFLYSNNIELLPLGELLRPLVIITIGLIIILLVIKFLFKNPQKVTLLLSVFLLFFFIYGHIHSLMPDIRWHISKFVLYPNTVLLPVWGFCILVLSFIILRLKTAQYKLTMVSNIASILLVTISIVTSFSSLLLSKQKSWTASDVSVTSQTEHLPDIYYIILDGYAGTDILSDIFNFDNSNFIKALKDRNFKIALKSRSNYCQTILSLSSSLNLTYLDEVAKKQDPSSGDRKLLIQMIKDNNFRNFLKSMGYKFAALSSGYYGTEITNADVYITPPGRLNEFEEILLNTTPLPVVIRKFKSIKLHKERILYNLNYLTKDRSYETPVFMFAHFICPHPPFVFDEDGRELIADKFQVFAQGENGIWPSNENSQNNYINQISFMNNKMLVIIDSLLSYSETLPIIILQGDHGSLFPRENISESASYREKFSILNAMYLPGYETDSLPDNISPVNTFRIISNLYFETDYKILADESYFSEWATPYNLKKVTELVKYKKPEQPYFQQ